MLGIDQIDRLIGQDVVASDGSRIGSVGQVYVHDDTGEPSFATVRTGLFGSRESFVPLDGAQVEENALVVPYAVDQVKDAPNVESDGHISEDEERRIFEHYALTYDTPDVDITDRARTGEGVDTSGPTTDEAMTRSEEQVNVGTRSVETGRVRLRKYVVTEQENITVPVRKEKAVLEREPITDANVDEAMSGPEISEEEHEVVLSEERPVVEKTVNPVERVRLGTEEVVDEQTITEDVRKERIETEGDIDRI